MSHLRPILLTDPQEGDLEWIDKLAGFSYYEETTKSLLERGRDDDLKFWRFEGQGFDGIIAGRTIDRLTLKEFWIEFVTGKGLIKNRTILYSDIQDLARELGCSRVSWIAPVGHESDIYEIAFGLKPKAMIFTEDVPNGQE